MRLMSIGAPEVIMGKFRVPPQHVMISTAVLFVFVLIDVDLVRSGEPMPQLAKFMTSWCVATLLFWLILGKLAPRYEHEVELLDVATGLCGVLCAVSAFLFPFESGRVANAVFWGAVGAFSGRSLTRRFVVGSDSAETSTG